MDELVPAEPLEIAAPAGAVGRHDPDEERVAAEKRVAPGLTVSAPELLARADPAERSRPDPSGRPFGTADRARRRSRLARGRCRRACRGSCRPRSSRVTRALARLAHETPPRWARSSSGPSGGRRARHGGRRGARRGVRATVVLPEPDVPTTAIFGGTLRREAIEAVEVVLDRQDLEAAESGLLRVAREPCPQRMTVPVPAAPSPTMPTGRQ